MGIILDEAYKVKYFRVNVKKIVKIKPFLKIKHLTENDDSDIRYSIYICTVFREV